ncbi:helix-turn-helix domain-containing protein [Sinorhizobium medicae]
MKVKLTDIARRAGVGHATVDRVLNERGGVKPDTAKRVLDAARELGLARTLPKLYRNGLRFEVLLGRRDNPPMRTDQ